MLISTYSDLAEGGTPGGPPIIAEVAGAKTTRMIGIRYDINLNLALALGVTYDNNKAVLVRPGLTIHF